MFNSRFNFITGNWFNFNDHRKSREDLFSYSYLILAHFLCAWDAFTTRERPSGAGKQPPLLSAVSAVTITDNSKSFVFKTILVPFDIQVEFLLNPLWLKSVIPSSAVAAWVALRVRHYDLGSSSHFSHFPNQIGLECYIQNESAPGRGKAWVLTIVKYIQPKCIPDMRGKIGAGKWNIRRRGDEKNATTCADLAKGHAERSPQLRPPMAAQAFFAAFLSHAFSHQSSNSSCASTNEKNKSD
ncbi:hypothetical protein B0H13DRAFT_1905549 [Mycena leptocephala]|nr:hypothetical protein B0H13DRAFT_1905549 [Mycena leptocephala]